jgi:type II secretory pathway pseudopilin PulG
VNLRNNPGAPPAAASAAGTPRSAAVRPARSAEGGFVLLTLLFFAAAIAFLLVMAMPRAAMQTQRVREETLIYRGEQYKRAVQLYFRKYKKYPAKLDDLEESDGVRFLRRRYKDPLTGEDEWRLIHMGTDGRFKDSLLFDQEKEEDAKKNPYTAAAGRGNAASSGASFAAGNAFRGADRARAEQQSAAPDIPGQGTSAADYLAAGLAGQGPGDGSAATQGEQPQDGSIPYPNYATTLPSQIPSPTGAGAPVMPTANNPYGTPAGVLPANQQSGNRQGLDPRQRPMAQPGMVGGMPPGMAANMPGAVGNMPGAVGGSPAAGRSAADLIRNLLTTPRPGGLAGIRNGQGVTQAQPSFAEGIAGVASKVEQRGVKVYNERELYNEWEFVYDYRQDASMAGAMGGPAQAGNINPAQPGVGAGGTLQIDPSQVAVPGVAGLPGGVQPGVGQPTDGANPYSQEPVPALPGTSPFDPASGAYPQPASTPPTTRPNRNSRRRGSPPPLPGQPIYPVGGTTPNQPGQPSPFGELTQPAAGTQDPNQTTTPGTQQQP